MNFIPIIIVIWVFAIILSLYYWSKPSKFIVEKYGQPTYHFSSKKCWKTMPIRGTRIDMDFYTGFIVISEGKKDWILSKDFKNYNFYGTYLTLVFEIEVNEQKIQILLTRRQKKLLCEFLGIE